MKSKYIVLEGPNGCGKGTQLRMLTEYIYNSSRHVFVSRIRTPNQLDENGRLAREILKSDGNAYENGVKATEHFGKNHITTAGHIDSLLKMGHYVISDRNYLSTFAFQHAQGIENEVIAQSVSGSKRPDFTILIDVPEEVCDKRLSERTDGEGRRKFDSDLKFMGKVRQNYLSLPDLLPNLLGDNSIVVINGNQPIEEVWKEIKNIYDLSLI